MIEFKPVTLDTKDEINLYLKQEEILSSELCFTTFYIWQKAYDIQYAVVDGCLLVRFRDNGYPPSLRMPLGKGDKKSAFSMGMESLLKDGFKPKFYGGEDLVNWVNENYPDKFSIEKTRDYFDYVYLREDLVNLSGKKYHGKKNHLNSFLKLYDYKMTPITPDDYNEIMTTYETWADISDKYLKCEFESIGNLILNMDKLDIFGAKIKVNDELCAFTFAERLNGNTAVVHIEKANTAFKGSYAAINKLFAEKYLNGFTYINREEDCGIEGLRKAKTSYHPCKFTEKYVLILKEEEEL